MNRDQVLAALNAWQKTIPDRGEFVDMALMLSHVAGTFLATAARGDKQMLREMCAAQASTVADGINTYHKIVKNLIEEGPEPSEEQIAASASELIAILKGKRKL